MKARSWSEWHHYRTRRSSKDGDGLSAPRGSKPRGRLLIMCSSSDARTKTLKAECSVEMQEISGVNLEYIVGISNRPTGRLTSTHRVLEGPCL